MWLCCQDLRAKYVLNPVLLMCFLPELKQLLALCVGHKKKKKKTPPEKDLCRFIQALLQAELPLSQGSQFRAYRINCKSSKP